MNFDAVLETLQAERAKLDAAIAAIQSLNGQAISVSAPPSVKAPPRVVTPRAAKPSTGPTPDLLALLRSGSLSTSALAEKSGLSAPRVKAMLDDLAARKQVHRTGATFSQRWHLGPAKEAVWPARLRLHQLHRPRRNTHALRRSRNQVLTKS